MLPLDKGKAMDKLIAEARARWQVTIERSIGISYKSRRFEATRVEATCAALAEFYDRYPAIEESLVIYCQEVTR